MRKPLFSSMALIFAFLLSGAAPAGQDSNSADQRIALKMSAKDKADFLSEMRQMLASVQGVIAGIGTEDRALIYKSAKYSGNHMARATPETVRKTLPQSFKELGGPTHMMFEELAIRSETDDMATLAEFTGKLMKQCLGCHEMFRVK